jgi:hypothetical protein
MVYSCAIAQCQYYHVWQCIGEQAPTADVVDRCDLVNFIRDDREAASDRALSRHIYLS